MSVRLLNIKKQESTEFDYKDLLNIYKTTGNQNIEQLSDEVKTNILKLINKRTPPSYFEFNKHICQKTSTALQNIQIVTLKLFAQLTKEQRTYCIATTQDSPDQTQALLENMGMLDNLLNEKCDIESLIESLEARTDLWKVLLMYINHIEIKDENALIAIAKFCAQQDVYTLVNHIQYFGIKNENALIEIAMFCVQRDAYALINNIEHFKVKNENVLIEIIRFCIPHNAYALDTHDLAHALINNIIKHSKIKNEGVLIEIAKFCAQQNARTLINNIKYFEFKKYFWIKNKNDIIEIIKLCAQQSIYDLIDNIEHFCINDAHTLIEIIKIFFQQDSLCLIKNIKHFNLKSFNIENEHDIIEIAMTYARNSSCRLVDNIKHFNITDNKILFEIIKLFAQNDSTVVTNYTEAVIENFNIKNDQARIELALICANENPKNLLQNIKRFDIKKTSDLIDVAKVCAKKDLRSTIKFINLLNIKNEQVLLKIAMSGAKKYAYYLSKYINKFNIKNEQSMIRIFKLCIQQNLESVIKNINRFHVDNKQIINQETLIEIAMSGAKKCTTCLLQNINKFNIENKQSISEIAMICAQHNSKETRLHLRNLNIQDTKKLQAILAVCFIQDKIITNDLYNYLKNFHWLFNYLKKPKSISDKFVKNFKTISEEILGKNDKFLERINSLYSLPLNAQLKVASRLVTFLFALEMTCESKEDRQEIIEQTNLLKALYDLRSPYFCSCLIIELIKLLNYQDPKILNGIKELDKTQSSKKYLLDFLFYSLQVSGISANTIRATKRLFAPLFSHDKTLVLLETIYRLHISQDLSIHEKEHILNKLCEEKIILREKKKDLQKRMQDSKKSREQKIYFLLTILLLKEELNLVNYNSIFDYMKIILQEKFQLIDEDKSIDAFHQFFITTRAPPHTLITYAAKLSTLEDSDVMFDLKRYVNSVLNHTFYTDRYSIENNLHLKTIAKNHALILQNWQQALIPMQRTFVLQDAALFHAASWIRIKVQTDRHIDLQYVPHLQKLLNSEVVEEQSLLPVECALKMLITAQTQQEQIEALQKTQKALENLPLCVFEKDVAEQIDALQKKMPAEPQKVIVVDTDNYLDLLLCGTEVIGSCLNIAGFPDFNQGLLGYILDGKNRLIAIKNQKEEIIARAKLSLLWDGQQPVLFLERLYTRGNYHKLCMQAIKEMALRKAEQLGLPLTTLKSRTEHENFNRNLMALRSSVSYEYSDASEMGVIRHGKYQIDKNDIALVT